MSLRILLYGEDWEGTHIDSISRVFRFQNIIFEKFNFYPFIYIDSGIKLVNAIYWRLLIKINEKQLNRQLIYRIEKFKPNVLLISKGLNIYPDTLNYAKKLSILIINWNPDDFFNNKNSSIHIINSLPLYDYIFSARPHLFDEYISRGIRNPKYLEWYYLPWFHKKPNNLVPLKKKVTFIGTFSDHREYLISKIDKKIPIEIWGGQWDNSNILKQSNVTVYKKILSQDMFPQIMSESLINLNILTKENRDVTNLKNFEIPASYGLILTDFSQTIYSYLGDFAFYFDPSDLDSLNFIIDKIFTNYSINELHNIRHESYLHIRKNNNDIENRVNKIISLVQSDI